MSALTPPRMHANDAKNATKTAEKQRRSHSYPLNPYAEGSDDESACPLESVSNLSLSPRRGGGFNVSGGNSKRTDPWLRFRNVFSGRGFCDVAPSPSPSKNLQQSSSPSLESIDTEDTSHASQGGGCGADSASSSPLAVAPPAEYDGDDVGFGGTPVDEGTIAEAREAAMAAAAGAIAEAEAWRATTTAAVAAVEEDEEDETETDEDEDGVGSSEDEHTDDGEEEVVDESEGAVEVFLDHKTSRAHDSLTYNKEDETDDSDDSAHVAVTANGGGRREASLVAAALAISVGILAVAHRRDGGGGGATTAVPTATMKAPQLDAPLPQPYPNLDVDISGGPDGMEDDISMGIPPTLAVDEDDGPEVDGEEQDLGPDSSEGDGHEMETEDLVVTRTQDERGISSSVGEQNKEPENEEAEEIVHDTVALSEESVEESLSIDVHEENVAEIANDGVQMDLQESDDDDVAEVPDVDLEEDILSDVDDYVATGIEAEEVEARVDDIKDDFSGSTIAVDEGGKQRTESQRQTEEGPAAAQDAVEDDSEHVHVANPAFVPIRQRAGPTASPERRWGVKNAAGDTTPPVGGGAAHDLPENDATQQGGEEDRPKEDVSLETDDTVATVVPEPSVAISTHTRIDWKGVIRDLVSDATFTMRI